MKTTRELELIQMTGKSISEFRQDLVAFGNDLINRSKAPSIETAPGEVQIVNDESLASRTAPYDSTLPGFVPNGTYFA